MSDNKSEFLNEEPVTAGARPAEKMPRIVNTNPGQTGTPDNLGGPLTKPSPDTEPTPGKSASARAKKLTNKVTAGADAPMSAEKMQGSTPGQPGTSPSRSADGDPMPKLQGSTPGQSGVKEEEEYDENVIAESETEETAQTFTSENIEINVEEDVNALLSGEDLSEEFKFKAATIFEAAVKSKVVEELEKFEQIYEERLQKEVEDIKESIETRVEAHLDYVSDQWLVENQLAVDNGLRSELTEEFILGIKNVFESCYVDIPEDKYDILGEMSEKLDQMEEKLNEQIEVNVELNQTIGEFIKDGIVAEVSEGLAQTQKEKLSSLAEGVEFISEESYREKIEMIKESYFPKHQSSYAEDLVEQTQSESIDGPMAVYAAAIDRWAK
jgi:hypothetical protein